jgi:hypothetical protein
MLQVTHYQRESDLINKALGIAGTLTYNDDKPQAEAKHMLLEISRCLGRKCVSVKKNNDSLELVTLFGKWRQMTLCERLLYKFFGTVPQM